MYGSSLSIDDSLTSAVPPPAPQYSAARRIQLHLGLYSDVGP